MEALEQAPEKPGLGYTGVVLGLLGVFSALFSWIAVFAVPNALVAADMLAPWPADEDPRPGWMARLALGLFASFVVTGLMFRWISARQLRRIDAIAEE